MTRLPDANAHFGEIADRLTDGTPVVLLDFDGTLAPIVDRPDEAAVPEPTRAIVERLAEQAPVAVISGRDLEDVRGRVAIPNIAYSGSHGFEIQVPADSSRTVDKGEAHLERLDTVEDRLRERLADLSGAQTESVVDEVLAEVDDIAKSYGKQVFDLRPALDWDKGDAVEWLLDHLYPADVRAVYLGDDVTDEDAFEFLRERGVGIVVHEGECSSAAHYRLDDPGAVRRFLERLSARFDKKCP
ncbi:MAG: trehalose-phosphatase [Bradymonadaceae bacterium]